MNESPVMRDLLVTAWLLIIFSATGFANIVYLHKERNSSVHFTCESTNENQSPFAFTLIRDLVKQERVLYFDFSYVPNVLNEDDKHLISVQRDTGNRMVNVSILHLLGRHTDLYRCKFHYSFGKFEDFPGKTSFFLYVEDHVPEKCSCYGYEPLLYALSAAAVLLFACVVILAGVHCRRPSSPLKPQLVPIYEEMNGVRPDNRKVGRYHLSDQEDANMSMYIRPHRENPYDPLPSGPDPYSI